MLRAVQMLRTYRARIRNRVIEPIDPLPQQDCEAIVTVQIDDPETAEEKERDRQEAIRRFMEMAGCCRSGDPRLSERVDEILYGKAP